MLRAFEWSALLAFHLALAVMTSQVLVLWGFESLLWLLLALPLAIFLADLLTGLIHWVCDSIGSSTTPLWGPMLVKPFRDHHREPYRITQISLAENLGSSAFLGLIVLGLTQTFAVTWHPFGIYTLLYFNAFAVWSNLFHRWSHIPLVKRPQWLKSLQNYGLLLHPRTHSLHHRGAHRDNYCILNGWANVVTNRVPWERMEGFLKRFGVLIDFD